MQKYEAYSFYKTTYTNYAALVSFTVILGRYMLRNHCNELVKSDTSTLQRKD